MSSSIQHLKFINRQSLKTMKRLAEINDLNKIQYFCVGLIERLSYSSRSLLLLIKNIQKDHTLEYSCGIILRSMLLDTLIAYNLYDIMTNDQKHPEVEAKQKAVKDFCNTMLADGLENTLTYLKLSKDLNLITAMALSKSYKNFSATYQSFFQPYPNDGSKPILKINKFFSPKELFKNIAQNPKLKELSKIYDSYLFFSKYDHFGLLYYTVTRQRFDEQIKRIEDGIELSISTLSILHIALRENSNNDKFLNKQSNIIAKYLLTIIPIGVNQNN